MAEAAGEKLIAWLAQSSQYQITLFGYSLPLSGLLVCNSVPVHWNYIQIDCFCPAIGLRKFAARHSSIAMGFIRSVQSLLTAVLLSSQHVSDLIFIMAIGALLVTLFLVLADISE